MWSQGAFSRLSPIRLCLFLHRSFQLSQVLDVFWRDLLLHHQLLVQYHSTSCFGCCKTQVQCIPVLQRYKSQMFLYCMKSFLCSNLTFVTSCIMSSAITRYLSGYKIHFKNIVIKNKNKNKVSVRIQ